MGIRYLKPHPEAVKPPLWHLYRGTDWDHRVHFCLCGERKAWCACSECQKRDHYEHYPIQWTFCDCHLTIDLGGIIDEVLTDTT